MNYVSNGEIIDRFDGNAHINPNTNGEEYRLFGCILDLIQKMGLNNRYPTCCYGDCQFGQRFSGSGAFLAREQEDIPHFPDCVYVNDCFALCIDHFQINASEPRDGYRNGDEYRAFLARHADIVDSGDYEKLTCLLEKEGVVFTKENLVGSMIYSLRSKIEKIPQYKEAARQYIEQGVDPSVVQADLMKETEVWLLVEDVTPTTSFDSVFTNEMVLSLMRDCAELNGIIYIHRPFLTKAPDNIDEIVFIHNDAKARGDLRNLMVIATVAAV